MSQEKDIMAILQDKTLKKQLDSISSLLNDQLLAVVQRVYQEGVREGRRQMLEELNGPAEYRS